MGAEAAISAVVKLLGDVLIQKVDFLRGVEGQVQKLKEELTRMQSFLRDANEKQAQSESVRNWISDMREVALDAEDAIDMFTLNVENPRKSRGLLERCACFPNQLRHLDRIGEEIESIHDRLDAIRESRETYGIIDLEEPGEQMGRLEVEARRRLAPWEKNEDLVGVEDDVKKLLEPIMDEEKKGLLVTAIVGMGGIGKSTLAREVYNHPDVVSGRFDCRAWVVVSSEFTLRETIKQLILETSTSEQEKQKLLDEIKKIGEALTDGLNIQRELQEKLYRRLEGKTYFIVLDDVWKKEHLDSLISAFPKEQDPKMSWELFLKKSILGNRNGEFPTELEQTGRSIVEKCKGLPLSITVMGGLLSETRLNRAWEEALNQLCSHFVRVENHVSAILELSYQKLSPQLKCCFLCLSFFKEDATISVKRLLNIMVGLSLIQPTGGTTEEEIARGYLDELINRNVVLVKDLTLDNRVKSCHLHDSLRKICLKKAEQEIGLQNLIGDHRISLDKPRHCIVYHKDLGSLSKNKHVRSLFVLNVEKNLVEVEPSYWTSFQHLKIVDLDSNCRLERLPDSFQSLLGLKQLRIGRQYYKKTSRTSFYDDVHKPVHNPLKVPTWMNALKKLEIIDVRTEIVELPNVALKMDSLRHLHASRIFGTISISGWKNVETLKYIRLEDWMKSSSKLMDGCNVRALGIFVYNDVLGNHESSKVRASLEKLENLVKLYLLWGYNLAIDATIIPQVSSLTKLRLRGRLAECPSASMLPTNLSHLTLERSCLDIDPMQELSKLPKLSYLKLKNHCYLGRNMSVLHDGFPCLIGMSLQCLPRLRSVNIVEGGMPQLKLFQVVNCPALDIENLSNKSYQLQILTDTI